ncbi:hypothetical protein N7540_010681 [Penicillium herquei]|nr:hypothetical protein N7540_010681 [Penicillium herquei]
MAMFLFKARVKLFDDDYLARALAASRAFIFDFQYEGRGFLEGSRLKGDLLSTLVPRARELIFACGRLAESSCPPGYTFWSIIKG